MQPLISPHILRPTILCLDSYENLVRSLFSLVTQQSNVKHELPVIRELCYVLAVVGLRTFKKQWPTLFLDLFHLLNCGEVYENQYLVVRRDQMNGGCPEDYESLMEQRNEEADSGLIRSLTLSIPQSSMELVFVALEILSALPDELSSNTLTIGLTRRNDLSAATRQRMRALFFACHRLLGVDAIPKESVLKCLLSWSSLSVHPKDSIDSGCLNVLIRELQNPSHGLRAANIASQLLLANEWKSFPSEMVKVMQQVVTLGPVLQSVKGDDDSDVCHSMAVVVATLIENYSELIISSFDPVGRGLLEMLLMCTSNPSQGPSTLVAPQSTSVLTFL